MMMMVSIMMMLLLSITTTQVLAKTNEQRNNNNNNNQQQQQQQRATATTTTAESQENLPQISTAHHQPLVLRPNTQIIQIDLDYFLNVMDNSTTSSSTVMMTTPPPTTTPNGSEEEDEEDVINDKLRKKYNVKKNPAADMKNFPEKRFVSCCSSIIQLPLSFSLFIFILYISGLFSSF